MSISTYIHSLLLSPFLLLTFPLMIMKMRKEKKNKNDTTNFYHPLHLNLKIINSQAATMMMTIRRGKMNLTVVVVEGGEGKKRRRIFLRNFIISRLNAHTDFHSPSIREIFFFFLSSRLPSEISREYVCSKRRKLNLS